ncbi:LysR family transcriptional regulator [Mesorhizobium sp. M0213]|uniref:LysR family transcriptional regulator n=1 Tax=Mesorhizobium sp. M0213 TaxID=2956917 RepID=UPI0033371798
MDDMILLAEVAETGSFTRAGERIGMPKSTVSQRIAQLEARLGLRLLNRSTRHVSLTGSGQVYLEYCRRVRAEVLAANMAMTNLREQPVGKLKITCPEVTATYFMPSFLHGFTTQFPGIAIELIATNRHLNIIRERVDFAFRVGTTTGQLHNHSAYLLNKTGACGRASISGKWHSSSGTDRSAPAALSGA